ncbi:MAG: hypothetical protein ACRYFR_14405 [Janthinobacterium lividum]
MRFLPCLAAFCALATGLFLAGIFGLAPYAAVERLGHIAYFENVPDGLLRLPLPLTPGRYVALRAGAWALLGGGGLGALAQRRAAAYRRQRRRLVGEVHRAAATLGRTVRQWPRPQRAGARVPAALLGALPAFRVVELGTQVPALFENLHQEEALVRSYRWLRAQPPGDVFLVAPYHQFLFFHYGLLNGHPLALHSPRRAPYLWCG